MKYRFLKWSRVVIAAFFLILLFLLFVDFRKSFSKEVYNWAVSLQLVPAVLKSVTAAGGVTIGAILLLALTLLFGRVYCSFLCPLGIFQDVVSRIGGRIRKKSKYKFSKAFTYLRISLLVLVLLPLLAGSISLVTLLDPYSLFGRISTTLFKPLLVWVNNLFAAGFAKADIYNWLYRYDMIPVHPVLLMLTTLFAAGVLLLSFYRGRLYCNTICPVGTFLGYLSKISLFRVRLSESQCTRCGKCARVCKAECIEVKSRTLDASRCVACYNCLTVCTEKAISCKTGFKSVKFEKPVAMVDQPQKEKPAGTMDPSKRSFLVTGALGIAALYGFRSADTVPGEKKLKGVAPKPHGQSTIPEKKTSPVSPPGSQSVERFNKICTGCSLCISACPTKVLQPAFLQYGLIGMMQPYMDYRKGLCEFDCNLCSNVCPTGAILPLTTEAKHVLQIGQVHFEKRNCIVETEKTDCGACSEHCPTKAVHMVPYGKLFIPEVDQKICVGCGACEYACPTTPFKAIFVDGNPKHLVAEKPKTEKAKSALKEGEFPF
ncbi:MAG: 4Fe-4S binding protein [Marinilabiliales bacterium]|nr:4Fe-4S binding protein [Marinilabiliales bacterium]